MKKVLQPQDLVYAVCSSLSVKKIRKITVSGSTWLWNFSHHSLIHFLHICVMISMVQSVCLLQNFFNYNKSMQHYKKYIVAQRASTLYFQTQNMDDYVRILKDIQITNSVVCVTSKGSLYQQIKQPFNL